MAEYTERNQELKSLGLYVGVDLGQAQDYTAVVIVERLDRNRGDGQPPGQGVDLHASVDEYHVVYCERLPLGISYEDQKQRMKNLLERARKNTKNAHQRPALIVDATGVGRPVIDSFREDGLSPVAVTVHGGENTTHDNGMWRVPKRDLVAAARVLLGKKQLKIGKVPFADVLITELQNFHVKVNIATGHDSYEAWREGAHDDLVFALCLACWYALKQKKIPTGVGPIIGKPRPRPPRY